MNIINVKDVDQNKIQLEVCHQAIEFLSALKQKNIIVLSVVSLSNDTLFQSIANQEPSKSNELGNMANKKNNHSILSRHNTS